MKYPQHILFSEETAQDDEIDRIFSQLPVIEPPEVLIERILDTVSHLPRPQCLLPPLWDGTEGLIVRHDRCEPS